jgi:hypothetical protein
MSNKKYKNNRNNKLLDKKLALHPDNKVDEVEAYNNFLSGIYYDPSHIPKVNPHRYNNTK